MLPYNRRRGVIPYQRRNYYGGALVGATAVAAKTAYNAGKWAVSKLRKPWSQKKVTATIASKPADKKKKTKRLGKKAPLKKRVTQLERMVHKLDSKYTYRRIDAEQITASANLCGWNEFAKSTPSGLETAFANLRYYDPATPGTIIAAGMGTGTFSRDYNISGYSKILLRNNDLVPVDFHLYLCECKESTSNDVLSLLDGALADLSAIGKTSTTCFLSDGKSEIEPYWKYKLVKKMRLMPGGEFSSSHIIKPFDYDPTRLDVITSTYQPMSKTFSWVIRVQGTVCHDKTTTGNVGITAAALDCIVKTIYTCRYNSGGPSLTYIGTSDNLDALAAGGVVSQLSTRNQEYSLAAV